jgi:hypothetical protein
MRPVHMAPDESVQAWLAMRDAIPGEQPPLFGAMHFGTFKLTDEAMDEPPRRLREEWSRLGLMPAALSAEPRRSRSRGLPGVDQGRVIVTGQTCIWRLWLTRVP